MKKPTLKRIIIIILIILALSISTYGLFFYYQQEKVNKDNKSNESSSTKNLKEVEIIEIQNKKATSTKEYITTVGSVEPQSKINVVALSSGRIVSLPFSVGDKIEKNQILAYLDNQNSQTSYLNARTNYQNSLSQLEATKNSAQENVNQAEINVENAENAVDSAEIQLKKAKTNYNNTLESQEQTIKNTKDDIIVSFNSYLKTIKNTLDDINYLLNVEGNNYLEEASTVLGAKSYRQLNATKNEYRENKKSYLELAEIEIDKRNLEYYLDDMIALLEETKNTTDSTLTVLDNTVTSTNFPQSSLDAQKSKFNNFYSSLVSSLQKAKGQANNLESLKIQQKNQLETLQENIESAENQLETAKTSYNKALNGLEAAKKNKQQQILSTQSSVDNTLGQLKLTQEQLDDLVIKSNISGTVLEKKAEVGEEVNPGQVVAVVGNIENLKIKINLSSEDIYKIKEGQPVIINDDIEAQISSISPSADSKTKKVNAEITLNQPQNLITGTFVDVKIKTSSSISQVSSKKTFAPLKAVTIGQNQSFVFVASSTPENNYIAERKEVSLGELKGETVEIIQGLKEGDKLIVENNKFLEDKEKINLVN